MTIQLKKREVSVFSAKFERIHQNHQGRDFAVGDIHGYFTALQAGLDHIGFDPAVDRLFAVGDLVDRGPESRMVIDWLEKPWFHSIFRNHEEMICHAVLRADPGIGVGDEWLSELDNAEKQRIAQRLVQLPLGIEVETEGGLVGLIHADCPYDDWDDIQETDWSRHDESSPLVQTCLWSTERYQRKYTGTVKNIRAVVHGHVTLRDVELLGNVHYIDTKGGNERGKFTFLDLKTLDSVSGPGDSIVKIPRKYR